MKALLRIECKTLFVQQVSAVVSDKIQLCMTFYKYRSNSNIPICLQFSLIYILIYSDPIPSGRSSVHLFPFQTL